MAGTSQVTSLKSDEALDRPSHWAPARFPGQLHKALVEFAIGVLPVSLREIPSTG